MAPDRDGLYTYDDDSGAVVPRRGTPPGEDPGAFRGISDVRLTVDERAAIAASDEADRLIGARAPRGPTKARRVVIGWSLEATPYKLRDCGEIAGLGNNIEARKPEPKRQHPTTPPWWLVRQSKWHDPAEDVEPLGRRICQRCAAPRRLELHGASALSVARERLWLPLHRPWEQRTHWCEACAAQVDAERRWLHQRLAFLRVKERKQGLTDAERREIGAIGEDLLCAICRGKPSTGKWWRNDWTCNACWKAWTRADRPRGDEYDDWARQRRLKRLSQAKKRIDQGEQSGGGYHRGREGRKAIAADKLAQLVRVPAGAPVSDAARRTLDSFDADHAADDWRSRLRAFESSWEVGAMKVRAVIVEMDAEEAERAGLVVIPREERRDDRLGKIVQLRTPVRSA